MGGKGTLPSIAAASAVAIVLSPWYAPVQAFAGTITQGQQVTIPISSLPQGQTTSTSDLYQYQFTLEDGAGNSLSSLPIESPSLTLGTQSFPLEPITGQDASVTSVVYSVYGSQLPQSGGGSITLNPLDIGSFQIASSLCDVPTGTTVGQAVYTPLDVAQGNSSLYWQYAPGVSNTGQQQNFNLGLDSLTTTDAVYYHFQVLNNGQPVNPGDVQLGIVTNQNPYTTSLLSLTDGIGTYGYPNGEQLPPLSNNFRQPLQVSATFNTPGTYTLLGTAVDATTGADLGTASTQVQVGNPNVTGTSQQRVQPRTTTGLKLKL